MTTWTTSQDVPNTWGVAADAGSGWTTRADAPNIWDAEAYVVSGYVMDDYVYGTTSFADEEEDWSVSPHTTVIWL